MDKRHQIPAGTFKNTFCIFKEVIKPAISSRKFDFESKSGSCYYFTQLGMYRRSNHWGRLANSKWRLEPLDPESESKTKWGFAEWTDFHPDNATELLYYIEVDYSKGTVNYQHKNNPNYNSKAVLRTSFETTKKIKQIRNLLNLTSWANYFEYEDINELRQKIIEDLIYTNQTLEIIKREIQQSNK
jgi:hypothetical protein